jgi:hypothetical protein
MASTQECAPCPPTLPTLFQQAHPHRLTQRSPTKGCTATCCRLQRRPSPACPPCWPLPQTGISAPPESAWQQRDGSCWHRQQAGCCSAVVVPAVAMQHTQVGALNGSRSPEVLRDRNFMHIIAKFIPVAEPLDTQLRKEFLHSFSDSLKLIHPFQLRMPPLSRPPSSMPKTNVKEPKKMKLAD